MTGHQPHPGTGRTMMGEIVEKIDIESVLKGVGVTAVETVDPMNLQQAVECVNRISALNGVKAIIFKSPCAVLEKPAPAPKIDKQKCIQCKKCIRELGCPGIVISNGTVEIDSSLCNGCGLCAQICPVHAIGGGENE